MANLNRRSRVSQNRNRSRRQSLRRGGAPPSPPSPPAAPAVRPDFLKGKKMTGKEAFGSSVCPPLPQEDCTKVPACRWNNASANGKRAGYCSRKPEYEGMSESRFANATADLEAERDRKRKALYMQELSESSQASSQASSPDVSLDSPMPSVQVSALPVFRGSRAAAAAPAAAVPQAKVSRKSPAPAQVRRAAARAANVPYVPVKSANVPQGCVLKNYDLVNKRGTAYTQSRCVDSKDPNVNDSELCMINPETNKCKKVVRA